MMLTACGGAGNVADDTDSPSTSAVDPDAVLRYGAEWALSSFDPHKATIGQDNTPIFLAYDRLVHLDPLGNPIPGLATDWEYSEDRMALTMNLREGVTFQDGAAFDAEAAKANLDRVRTLPESTTASAVAMVEEVEVTGDMQITLHLTAFAPEMPLTLSDRTGAMISPDAFDNPDLDRAPVGAGMYKVTEYVANDHIMFERNEGYWDAEAVQLAGIDFRIMPDPKTRINALRAGQVDWTVVTPLDYAAVADSPDYGSKVFTATPYRNVWLNRAEGTPLADVRVRQALNLGIDRAAMSEVITSGLAEPCGQTFPVGYVAFNDEVGCDYYPYDPDKARDLLADAGYDGTLEIGILTGPTPNFVGPAEVLQAQWAEIGVTATITPDPGWGTVWVGGEHDTLFGTWGGRPSPFQTLYANFMPEGVFNVGHATDEEVVAAYEEALSAATEDEQKAALQRASKIVVENALEIPLWQDPVPNVWSTKVVGAESYLSGRQEFRGVYMTE